MALDLQKFSEDTNKIPTSSGVDLSTWEGDGDSSSDSTRSQCGPAITGAYPGQSPSEFRGRSPDAGSNRERAVDYDDSDHDDDDFYADQANMPSTREPSPEPLWRTPNQYGQEYVPQVNQVFMIRDQINVKPPPMMWPTYQTNAPYGKGPLQRVSLTPPPGNVLLMPPHMAPAPQPTQAPPVSHAKAELKNNSKKQEEVARSKSRSKGNSQGSKKSNAKTRGEASAKGDALSNMSDEKKQTLLKYIYDFMLENGFTNPEGYLLVDVLAEVWKEMGDEASGGRIAQYRFAELLRGAPEYFELFRKGIRVTNHCGWFARKGEKMVRLVPQTSP